MNLLNCMGESVGLDEFFPEEQMSFDDYKSINAEMKKYIAALKNANSFNLRDFCIYESKNLNKEYAGIIFPRTIIEDCAYDAHYEKDKSKRKKKVLDLVVYLYWLCQVDAQINKAKTYFSVTDKDDLFQTFVETVLTCVEKYDPFSGGNFENYFNAYLNGELKAAKRKSLPLVPKKAKEGDEEITIEKSFSMYDDTTIAETAVFEDFDRNAMNQTLYDILDKLPNDAGKIISYKYGLDRGLERSWTDTCEKFNLTQKSIRRIVTRGFKAIKEKYPTFGDDYFYLSESTEKFSDKDAERGQNTENL